MINLQEGVGDLIKETKNIMKPGIANKNWPDNSSRDQRSINFHRFTEADNIVSGIDFIVICKNEGWIEVYDNEYNLISTEVFLNFKALEADEFITVTLKNGWSETYDKWFNMQSIKFCG